MPADLDPDAALMLRVKQGDTAAFTGLVEKYKQPVLNLAFRTLRDETEAEDLAQTVFVQAWKSAARYQPTAKFSTWLFTIARRVAQDHYRKPYNEISLADASNIPTNELMEDTIQQDADFAHLSVLLARLADRERELVALKYGAGLTNRTIARLSGLSESNVGVILHRTMQTLRSEWEHDHER